MNDQQQTIEAKAEETQKKKPDSEQEEDAELGGSMTFLEHLEELRERLIRALVSFAVCTIVCFIFSEQILNVLIAPLPNRHRSIAEEYIHQWGQNNSTGSVSPKNATAELTASVPLPATPTQDINASQKIATMLGASSDRSTQLITTSPFEGILAYVKISVIAGIFFAFPIIFYQAWMFIAPGLYKREKKVVLPIITSAWICFILGGIFCYFVIYSFILVFLQFYTPQQVNLNWTLTNYISVTTNFILAFGVIFEEPVIIALLAKIGLVSAKGLGKFRSYALVIIFTIAALITPPDPFSQTVVAIPLYLLYEVSILVVRMIERGRPKEDESYA